MWELHLYLIRIRIAAAKSCLLAENTISLRSSTKKVRLPKRDFALNEPLGVDQRPVAVGNGGERVMWIYEKKLQ